MNTEIWKIITDFPNYSISSFGNVKNNKTGKYRKQIKNLNNYMNVVIFKGNKHFHFLIHRLVALEFIPNLENKKTVNHINHIRDDNNINNLEWATQTEQNNHQIKNVNNTNGKKIKQYSLDGKYIQTFSSGEEIIKKLNIKNVLRVCNKKRKSAGGFLWEFEIDKPLQNEIWKQITIDNFIFTISNKGRVKDKYNRIILGTNNGGYKRVRSLLGKESKTLFVHRLVAIAFISNPENKKIVNHIDGIRYNNDVDNLEWSTHTENSKHSIDILGNNQKSVCCYSLTGKFIKDFKSIKLASEEINIHRNTIISNCRGRKVKQLEDLFGNIKILIFRMI